MDYFGLFVGAEGENRFWIYLFIFIEIKNIKIFYTNVRTNKPELLPEFESILCPNMVFYKPFLSK